MGMHAVTWPILITEAVKYLKLPIPSFYTLIFIVWMLAVLFSAEKKIIQRTPNKKTG